MVIVEGLQLTGSSDQEHSHWSLEAHLHSARSGKCRCTDPCLLDRVEPTLS